MTTTGIHSLLLLDLVRATSNYHGWLSCRTQGQARKRTRPPFPLTPHAIGQCCKSIRGKVRPPGVWADPQPSLNRYHAVTGDLHAGRQPLRENVAAGELTVKDACNAFLI